MCADSLDMLVIEKDCQCWYSALQVSTSLNPYTDWSQQEKL